MNTLSLPDGSLLPTLGLGPLGQVLVIEGEEVPRHERGGRRVGEHGDA